MIIGQTIEASGADQVYLSPWFPRQEDNAAFTYERIHSTLASNETVSILTKRAEDAGTGDPATAGSFSELGASGIFESFPTNVDELVRYKVVVPRGSGWLHFRFLPPTWFAEAEASTTP